MARRDLSREELFALVWERPTSEIANELGISEVAVGKLCEKLQVPKPPRGIGRAWWQAKRRDVPP